MIMSVYRHFLLENMQQLHCDLELVLSAYVIKIDCTKINWLLLISRKYGKKPILQNTYALISSWHETSYKRKLIASKGNGHYGQIIQ